MDNHLDWISFTLDRGEPVVSSSQLYHEAKELLRRLSDEHQRYIFDGTGWEPCGSRAPYRFALGRDDNGLRIFGGGAQTGILYELSGRACEGLRSFEAARKFLSPIVDRITRLDYACDVLTDTRPAAFCNERTHQGFRSLSYIQSQTGETVYVGSPKSDRFCRVYRYNPPHPRSRLLRIEFVFRRSLAKNAARSICGALSEQSFAAALGNTYGWSHRDWQPEYQTDERLKTDIVTRADEDTINWLYKQVAPAIARMLKTESLNLADYLEYVISLNTAEK